MSMWRTSFNATRPGVGDRIAALRRQVDLMAGGLGRRERSSKECELLARMRGALDDFGEALLALDYEVASEAAVTPDAAPVAPVPRRTKRRPLAYY